MNNKVCIKCGRELPDGYKHKKCDNCRMHFFATIKKLILKLGGLFFLILTFLLKKKK